MDRNDVILTGALTAACCGIGLTAIAAQGNTGTAADWAAAIGSVGAIITAILVPRFERSAQQNREQTLAEARVAAPLRTWLSQCATAVADLQSYNNTNGNLGNQCTNIPPLNFDPKDVPLMRLNFAKRIYSIDEQRSRAVDSILFMAAVGGPGDDEDEFFKESAKLFRRIRRLYRELALAVGLHPYTCSPYELRAIDAAGNGRVKGWAGP